MKNRKASIERKLKTTLRLIGLDGTNSGDIPE